MKNMLERGESFEVKKKVSLVENLSLLYMEKGLPLGLIDKDEFLTNIAYFVKSYSLSGLNQTLKLFHQIFEHQDSNIVLECKNLHCIQCYYYFVDIYFFEGPSPNCQCTCGKSITPKIRKRIIDNYERIISLRQVCKTCSKTKDIMEYCVYKYHSCLICSQCIFSKFDFLNESNCCSLCGSVYDAECSNIIKSLMQEFLPSEMINRVYGGACAVCQEVKDKRFFMKICVNQHECCEKCAKSMIDSRVKNCFGQREHFYHF
jgi:hypothetical protein